MDGSTSLSSVGGSAMMNRRQFLVNFRARTCLADTSASRSEASWGEHHIPDDPARKSIRPSVDLEEVSPLFLKSARAGAKPFSSSRRDIGHKIVVEKELGSSSETGDEEPTAKEPASMAGSLDKATVSNSTGKLMESTSPHLFPGGTAKSSFAGSVETAGTSGFDAPVISKATVTTSTGKMMESASSNSPYDASIVSAKSLAPAAGPDTPVISKAAAIGSAGTMAESSTSGPFSGPSAESSALENVPTATSLAGDLDAPLMSAATPKCLGTCGPMKPSTPKPKRSSPNAARFLSTDSTATSPLSAPSSTTSVSSSSSSCSS